MAAFVQFWCHYGAKKLRLLRGLGAILKNSATTLQIQNTIVNFTIAGHVSGKCLNMANSHLAGRIDRMVKAKAEATEQLLCMGYGWAKCILTD